MSIEEATRRARRIRQELRDAGEVFSQARFEELLLTDCADLASSALQGLVRGVAKKIDDDSTRVPTHRQQELFPLDKDYKLGDNNRIAKRFARIEHAEIVLELSRQNRLNVEEADDRLRREIDTLRPYWPQGTTKEEAVMAWLVANPGQGAA